MIFVSFVTLYDFVDLNAEWSTKIRLSVADCVQQVNQPRKFDGGLDKPVFVRLVRCTTNGAFDGVRQFTHILRVMPAFLLASSCELAVHHDPLSNHIIGGGRCTMAPSYIRGLMDSLPNPGVNSPLSVTQIAYRGNMESFWRYYLRSAP